MDIVRFARTLEETDMDDDFSDMIKDELWLKNGWEEILTTW